MPTENVDLMLLQGNIEADPKFNHFREAGMNYVPGSGTEMYPPIMFIGEGPGPVENKTKTVLSGRSGKIFNEALKITGYTRDQVYMTNVLKYMSTDEKGRSKKPAPFEIEDFSKYVADEILSVSPIIVCVMGTSALSAIFPNETSVSKVRGKLLEDKMGNRYLVTYPPSYFEYPDNKKYSYILETDFGKLAHYARKFSGNK